jgi:Cu/Ag efflux protein CusF
MITLSSSGAARRAVVCAPRAAFVAAVVLAASSVSGIAAANAVTVSPIVAAATYQATGTVKSFGPDRAWVNIAHDDIPGYMKAMTMSFRPRSADQLAKLAAGDAVRFQFVVLDDGRRVLDWIAKR